MSKKKSPINARRWLAVHRWAGLIVAINLLLVSATGILLIFHDDIGAALGTAPEGIEGRPSLPISALIEKARAAKPGENVVWVFQDDDEFPGLLYVGMNPTGLDFEKTVPIVLNRETGAVVPIPEFDDTFVGVIFHLHVDLMMGPVGQFLVGLVGVAFLVTLITGFVVYGPMMRRFSFGTLRSEKQRRTYFADVHKVLGAATFGWNVVVAFTGVLLELGGVLFQVYAMTDIQQFAHEHVGSPVVTDLSGVDVAIAGGLAGAQRKDRYFLMLPGTEYASPAHYAILYEGGEGFESKLKSFALIDATAPFAAHQRPIPAYLKALMLSEPLHFGDYGGLPLQIVWTIFGLITMTMAGTGIYVFFASRKNKEARDEAIDADPESPDTEAEVTP